MANVPAKAIATGTRAQKGNAAKNFTPVKTHPGTPARRRARARRAHNCSALA
jgi:hypothetical protein